MSDHSDLVARLRNIDKESVFSIPYLCTAAADALDVKPGANADLIAEARQMIAGTTFFRREDGILEMAEGSLLPTREAMIARLADALEATDSGARVLPTRDQILSRVRQVVRDEEGEEDGDSITFCERVTDAVLALLTGGKTDD